MRNKYIIAFVWAFSVHTDLAAFAQRKPDKTVARFNLAGTWGFQIDSLDHGIAEKWFVSKLTGKISLPGSMTTNRMGDAITVNTPWTGSIFDSSWYHKPEYAKYRAQSNLKVPFWLQPEFYYKGVAWYQKMIVIPKDWKGKSLELQIERAHWEVSVWIDSEFAGKANSLAAPDIFDLSSLLSPGNHVLTIRIDNRIGAIGIGQNSHSITDHTQGNWNGMIGDISIYKKETAHFDDIQVFPDVYNKQVGVRIKLRNTVNSLPDLKLRYLVEGTPGKTLPTIKSAFTVDSADQEIHITYPMGSKPLLWDEFQPNVYRFKIFLYSKQRLVDSSSVSFGMRDFSSRGTQFSINGRLTFLRGALDCAVFPLTGYPATDLGSWLKIFKKCKSYGLNHIRFHSWCPPEAAFEAADRTGLYLQIECSDWANQGATIGDHKPVDNFVYEESQRIVKTYGNHPSFCLMTYGNEPAGEKMVSYLTGFVNYWKAIDKRRLYTTAAGWPIVEENDYNSTSAPRIQQWGAGLKSLLNAKPPRTDYDWRAIISKWQHPTISHEIGQWCVYPDFTEIVKYTGILKAKNFEIFREQLHSNGLGAFEKRFLNSSGALQALCYKADVEAALRTPGFGGFQLLGLSDFPGQGTALVGVLNSFWNDKGYISGRQFRNFCTDIVPLARFPKMVYLNDESLVVPVEVAQFGPGGINKPSIRWSVTGDDGRVLFSGTFKKSVIPNGNGISIGIIRHKLNTVLKPSHLVVTVYIDQYHNNWDIFVYPKNQPMKNDCVLVTPALDTKSLALLRGGGKVLLTLKQNTLKKALGGDISIGFSTIFWNTAWTNGQAPTTMGIFCDPNHPAFKQFPTQDHENWQWWDAMSHSNAMKLDAIHPGLQPIVRVIDDWVTARSLGLVFECRVGKGKLIVSSIDLLSGIADRPEAVQLLFSLISYMGQPSFRPEQLVTIEKIKALTD